MQILQFLADTNWFSSRNFFKRGKIYCYSNFFCYANFSIVFGPNFGTGELPQRGAPLPPVEESQTNIGLLDVGEVPPNHKPKVFFGARAATAYKVIDDETGFREA